MESGLVCHLIKVSILRIFSYELPKNVLFYCKISRQGHAFCNEFIGTFQLRFKIHQHLGSQETECNIFDLSFLNVFNIYSIEVFHYIAFSTNLGQINGSFPFFFSSACREFGVGFICSFIWFCLLLYVKRIIEQI